MVVSQQAYKVTKRRRLPFFRTEFSVELGSATDEKVDIPVLVAELIPELPADARLAELNGITLANLRGIEGEERILELRGEMLASQEEEEPRKFEIVLFSQFLDFKRESIRHKLVLCAPADLSQLKLSELTAQRVLSFRVGLEQFRPRVFTFLGNRIPELKERLELSIDGNGALSAKITDFDFNGVSMRAERQLRTLGRLCGNPDIFNEITKDLGNP
jgi:hypothetical protein